MDTGLIITLSVIFGIFFIISLIIFLVTRKRNANIKQDNNIPREIATINIGGNISQRSLIIGFRILIGISSVISLSLIYNKTQATVDKASNLGASAIQIMQIYSEGLFYAVIVTGIALSLYILSRAYIKNI